ncbi:response regulator [Pseudodesulfovibrio sp.]|uniref:response regulator n=1 Tax=Pseudodesulfovibrio sp. TaxID=2035812 RepID=UPI00262AF851|nr:response regulator [Pseudodesulfovibrio sp.]MDD3313478.1 response regulator [Pseudodesulfovibrio sp.]
MPHTHFLIVDDDERFAALVALKLSAYAQCTVALRGDDAVLQFEHHLREKAPFRAVFMDIEMPGMNGHEVVRQLRDIEERNGVNPVESFKLVMLTAHRDVKNVSKSFFRDRAEAYIPKDSLTNAEAFVHELNKFEIL